jgi:hypothetical protein
MAVVTNRSKYNEDGSVATGEGWQLPSLLSATTIPPSLTSSSLILGQALSRLQQVWTANQDTSVILYCFVMIALQMMYQQDMADRPLVYTVEPLHCSMVSVQICRIFLHLTKIAFVACNVCNVVTIACDKCNVTYIAYIAYIA